MTNAHVVSGAQRVQVVVPPTNADGSLMSALSPQDDRPAGAHRRRQQRDRSRAPEGGRPEGAGAAAGDLHGAAPGRDGVRVRQPGRAAQHADARPGLRRRAPDRSGFAADLHPDRRADQSRQLRRSARQHPRRSRRRQHVHHVAVGRQRRPRLRDPVGDGADGVPSAEAVRAAAAPGSRDDACRRSRRRWRPSLGLERDSGVIVADVWPGGPAEAAGVKIGDVLLSVDGQPAENLPTVNYFFRLRDSDKPVELVVLAGKTQKLYKVTPVEQSSDFDSAALASDPEQQSRRAARHHRRRDRSAAGRGAKGLRDPYGIIVAARAAGAVAEIPLLPRDIIRSFNNEQTASLVGLRRMLARAQAGRPGHAADSARGTADVRLVHDGVSEALPSAFRAESGAGTTSCSRRRR